MSVGSKIKVSSWLKWLLGSALIVLVVPEVLMALLPPTATDALIYHLAYPKLYLKAGKIFEISFAYLSYYPMNAELLFMVPLYFGRDYGTALIHMGFGLLTGLSIYLYLRKKIDKNYALLGALIFLSTPIVIKLSTIPYVDLVLAFFSTAAVLTLLHWKSVRSLRWLIFSGICAGLAAGTKYNGLYIILILAILVLYLARGERPIRTCALFLFISIAIASPWYIKNAIQTGNPFYPIFLNVSGGYKIPGAPSIPIFLKRHIFYGENWLEIMSVPIRTFFQGQDGSPKYFDGVLNPMLLLFLPFAVRRHNVELRYLGFFSVFYLLLVFFTSDMYIRFLLPVIPLLAIISTEAIKHLISKGGLVKYSVVAIVILSLGWNMIYLGKYFKKVRPIPYLAGQVTREEFLLKNLSGYGAYQYINRNLPQDAKVLLVYTGERGYYLDRDYYYNIQISGRPIKEALEKSTDKKEVAEYFRNMGYTHLLMNDKIFTKYLENNLDEKSKALFSDFYDAYLEILYYAKGYTVYRVRPKG